MSQIFIGTSGFTYQHWQGIFYPQDLRQKDWLGYYAKYFDTVEINASFYHTMRKSVYESWYEKTPKDFVFSVKGSRFITHIKKLKDCQKPWENFWASVSGLEEKLGVILWQLPPRWAFNELRLKGFLQTLLGGVKQAFEFRDKSWFSPKVYDILRKYNAGLVIADSPSYPRVEIATADFVYLRFHGHEALYASNYSDEELSRWAEKIKDWWKNNFDVYAYFNNDIDGYAVKNALTLKKLCC